MTSGTFILKIQISTQGTNLIAYIKYRCAFMSSLQINITKIEGRNCPWGGCSESPNEAIKACGRRTPFSSRTLVFSPSQQRGTVVWSTQISGLVSPLLHLGYLLMALVFHFSRQRGWRRRSSINLTTKLRVELFKYSPYPADTRVSISRTGRMGT